MLLLSQFSFVTSVICIIFAVYVLYIDWKSPLNRVFAFLSTGFSFWCLGYSYIYMAASSEEAMFWYRISSIGWINIVSLFIHFSIILIDRYDRRLIPLIYLPGIIFTVRSFTGVLYTESFIISNGMVMEKAAFGSFWFNLFIIYNFLGMLLFTIILYSFYRKEKSESRKQQIKIILLSAAVVSVFIYMMNVVFVFFSIPFPVTGHLAFFFGIAGIFYATVKYKFLGINSFVAVDLIIDNMEELLFLLNPSGMIIFSNDRVSILTGHRNREITGSQFIKLIEFDENELNELFSSLKAFNFRSEVKSSDGRTIPFKFSISPVMDKFNELLGYVVIADDISSAIDLEKVNRIMMDELYLAQRIQNGLIPEDSPDFKGVEFSVKYKPMQLLGGDFYDFIRIRDEEQIGIFISDVSGHGVSAALITGMIKTLLNTSGESRKSPLDLINFINKNLTGKTTDYFLTAFYGIYDRSSKVFTYSRAGHPPPLLIRDNDIIELKGKGTILGIKADFPLDLMTMECRKGDRILFYTDGLTETRNSGNEYFEDRIRDLLVSCRKNNLKFCTDKIYEELILFRGSDKFDDDVLLIGMEIQ